MHSSAKFILKSQITTFCSEECWPRIVQRPDSKRGIGTRGGNGIVRLLLNQDVFQF